MNAATTAIAAGAHDLLAEGFELYLASNGAVLDALDRAPLGLQIRPVDFLGPAAYAWPANEMLAVYNRLNAVAFGPAGIPLPRWVMVDLGLLPSAFLLVTLPPARVRAAVADPAIAPGSREMLEALLAYADTLGYAGPVAVAGYCAAPSARGGDWVGWSLCSARHGRGLAAITKAVALCAYRPRRLIGVTQYGNRALAIHRRFGPMRLVSATLALHDAPGSLVYETDLLTDDDDHDPRPTWMVGAGDTHVHEEMQRMLDAHSHQLEILRPGVHADGAMPVLATPLS